MNRNDDYSRHDSWERDRYRNDPDHERERESQPYGQREPYNARASSEQQHGRNDFSRTRWGAPTDYGYRGSDGYRGGASRYSESQYGQRRPTRDPYGRDFVGGGSRARDDEWGRGTGSFGEDYREGKYGSGDFGFEQGARGEPSFGASSSERYEQPRYFGSGNYGEGGSHYTGGWDQRGERSSYSGTSGSTGDPSYGYHGNPGSHSGTHWGSESHQERPGLLKRLFKRGPKGYQRSDERLREDISERLMQSGHVDSSDVTVNVVSGKVTLEGSVPDRYMKHYIEDLVDACPGVQDIDNRVRVGQPAAATTSTTTVSSARSKN